MTWIEFSINATGEAIDWISTGLAQSLTQLTQVTQAPVPEMQIAGKGEANWPYQVLIYLKQSQGVNAQVDQISALLEPLQRTGLISQPEIYVVDQKPVATANPERIGKFVLSVPTAIPNSDVLNSEAELGQAASIALQLSPRLAFGYGSHPATRLALQLVEQAVVPGMQALDLGSGTGILSVAMAKLGAEVLALDNDPIAVQATQEMIKLNQVVDQALARLGSLGEGSRLGHWMGGDLPVPVPAVQPVAAFDLVVANILARIHLTLAADYHQALKPNGLLITAGFTTEFESEVNAAFQQAGFTHLQTQRCNEWIALLHQA
jgi:ribosomal protein L11 methyltransferase